LCELGVGRALWCVLCSVVTTPRNWSVSRRTRQPPGLRGFRVRRSLVSSGGGPIIQRRPQYHYGDDYDGMKRTLQPKLEIRKRRRAEREVDILFAEPVMECDEVCLAENNRFVGATATFDDDWNVIPTCNDRLPSGLVYPCFHGLNDSVNPQFAVREKMLAEAAKCVCSIAIRDSRGEFSYGTAFFVGPVTLLTARHIITEQNDEIVAQYPGTNIAEMNIESLFQTAGEHELDRDQSLSVRVFKCQIVSTKETLADIMVLDCSASGYKAASWIELQREKLQVGDCVDVIGYPGAYSPQYLVRTQGDIAKNRDARRDMEELLPINTLTITHGPITKWTPITTNYRLSTVGGMSGSPVIVNGHAIGTAHFKPVFDSKAFTGEVGVIQIIAAETFLQKQHGDI